MEKRHLLFLVMLLTGSVMQAQTGNFCSSNDAPAADICSQACIYCNLSEYVGNTAGYTGQFAPQFCGTIENEQWLGFIAGANTATVTVTPINCLIGNGMQIAVYKTCNTPPLGCNMGGLGGGFTPVSVTVPLVPGTPYYLMIDSYAGDVCDFTVTVSPPGAALVGLIDTQVVALCPAESFTVNGQQFNAPAIVKDTLPNNSGGCDTIVVYNLVALPFNTTTTQMQFCPGESVTVNGVVYTESATIVDTIPSTNGGCDTVATYILQLLPQPTASFDLSLCPGASVTIGGEAYTAPDTVTAIIPATGGGCDTLATYNLTLLPYPEGSETLSFCPGGSVTIGGNVYSQTGTVLDTIPATGGGCDSIVTYTLTLLPYPEASESLSFCPGGSVTIGGNTYTQSGTVTDTIPASGAGCDTIVTYTLSLLPYPERSETIEFCAGETVLIGGNAYTQPGMVVDTILASGSGCDTIVNYTLQYITGPNTSVSITCKEDISIGTDPGTGPIVVHYDLPTASSDCPCPGIALSLTSGLSSGSLFPVTTTTVCYQAKDSCGNTATCCFDITVREEDPCDVKEIGCMKYELLSITRTTSSTDLTYSIRVTNKCANKMIYTAIQVPDGVKAVAPVDLSVYTAPGGRQYDVRNPNYSPFYSIRFKSKTDSIANGQSDIFPYTLKGQTKPDYIHITARLNPQLFYEAHLNTFNCPVMFLPAMKEEQRSDDQAELRQTADLNVYPNPTDGVLFADLSAWSGQEIRVNVFNSQGQLLRKNTLTAQDEPQQINLPETLAGGLYFLEVLTQDGEKHAARFVMRR
ncbi:MAG: HYR domain-containing protein [Lewinellaceae bacterium]|nr:HYR domain-containing protein [Lewinellaceae bacterium]